MAQLKGGTTIGGNIAYHGTNANLLTVDWCASTFCGSGAGLTGTAASLTAGNATNSQLLDSLSYTAFNRTYGRCTSDFNTFCTSGTIGGSSTNPNRPSSFVAVLVACNSDVGLQVAGGYTSDNLYFRGWYGSTASWTTWRTVIHDGTIAAQSVCCAQNANNLDGVSSGSFLRSDAADIKTSGNLVFNDNIIAAFGTSSDLHIVHDGSNSFINNSGTGNLYLRDASVNGMIISNTCQRLYNTGAEKFKTCTTGTYTTGVHCSTTCSRTPVHCSTTAHRTTGTGYRYCGGTGCGSAVDWVATSDCRIKKCVEPITSALSTIDALCGVCYELCEDDTKDMGLIAQDVLIVEPRLVSKGEVIEEYKKYGINDELLSLKYDKFAGLFVEAIKELKLEVEELKSEIKILKNS